MKNNRGSEGVPKRRGSWLLTSPFLLRLVFPIALVVLAGSRHLFRLRCRSVESLMLQLHFRSRSVLATPCRSLRSGSRACAAKKLSVVEHKSGSLPPGPGSPRLFPSQWSALTQILSAWLQRTKNWYSDRKAFYFLNKIIICSVKRDVYILEALQWGSWCPEFPRQ